MYCCCRLEWSGPDKEREQIRKEGSGGKERKDKKKDGNRKKK